ncbi:hypothetical protein [Streptococcus parasanguinis]|uniref:hypothetical protein n=1 Tax=Streptococcus parasanguinis TaxID=1318 RepID=UPI0020011BDD|nr:hypothetical protein [Streptococcus parasanguinis]
MENNKLKDLISKVQKWFYDRNLHTQEPNKQFLFSEAAKTEDYFVLMMDQALASYFNRQGYQLKSVVHELMRISQMLNYDFVECLNKAYEEIKDRKGKLVDGIWIKEERLK